MNIPCVPVFQCWLCGILSVWTPWWQLKEIHSSKFAFSFFSICNWKSGMYHPAHKTWDFYDFLLSVCLVVYLALNSKSDHLSFWRTMNRVLWGVKFWMQGSELLTLTQKSPQTSQCCLVPRQEALCWWCSPSPTWRCLQVGESCRHHHLQALLLSLHTTAGSTKIHRFSLSSDKFDQKTTYNVVCCSFDFREVLCVLVLVSCTRLRVYRQNSVCVCVCVCVCAWERERGRDRERQRERERN